MRTQFTGCRLLSFNNVTKWSFGFLAFTIPLILTIFVNIQVWKIILPCMVVLLPLLSEVIFRVISSNYLKRKLNKILVKKEFKISAIGMYIIPDFRNNPDEFNSKIQLSPKYLINIKIIFNYWNANLKLVGKTSINGKISSSFSATKVYVQFAADNSIKISYLYQNEYITTPQHKSKFISDFSGICHLHFNSEGRLIDYYYSSDGKNRFSFLKEFEIL